MLFRRIALVCALALLWCPAILAQDPGVTPRGIDALAAHAVFSTNFTFDKSMLDAMSQTMPEEERHIVAQLRSISVHSFRYSAPGQYGAEALDAVRAEYAVPGWQHLLAKQANAQTSDPTRTDLWVRMAHANLEGIVVLVANGRNVNLVTVDGTISPLDLLHLRGHFGIPQFSGDELDGAK